MFTAQRASPEADRRVLRVLFVDDSVEDVERAARALRGCGFDVTWRRVERADQLRAAVDEPWDVMIAEQRITDVDAVMALHIWREARCQAPAIVLAATGGEDMVAEALKAGAHDFVTKSHLSRLGPAVARELHEAELRRERERTRRAERFLSRASVALAQTLDYAMTLELVAHLCVPELADMAAVDVADDAGGIRRAAVAVDEGSPPASAEAMRAGGPCHPPRGSAHVVANGRAELCADAIEAAQLVPGARSYLCVPLQARGQVLGALTLVSCRASAVYRATDMALAEELAGRAALALDNARLYRSAREAIRVRDDFLSVAAHELRTPLTTLQLQIQSLLASLRRRGEGTPLEPRDTLKVERAVRSAERLTALVNSLVDVSRLTAGLLELDREPVEMGELAREMADRFEEEARRLGCELRVVEETPAAGHWDRVRLEQVLTNLLSNALKYGPGKPIDLVVGRADGEAELAVRDRGMGIAAEDLERIFGRFERAVSVRHYGGLGLGLYVAKQIVEAHGGHIRVESAPGAGATFLVRLPLG